MKAHKNTKTKTKTNPKAKKTNNIEILSAVTYKLTKLPATSKQKPPEADKTIRVSYNKDNETHYIDSSFHGTGAGIHWRIYDPTSDERKCGLVFNFLNNSVDITAYKTYDNKKQNKLPVTKSTRLPLKRFFSLIMQGKLK